jgi:hypothetical protein
MPYLIGNRTLAEWQNNNERFAPQGVGFVCSPGKLHIEILGKSVGVPNPAHKAFKAESRILCPLQSALGVKEVEFELIAPELHDTG